MGTAGQERSRDVMFQAASREADGLLFSPRAVEAYYGESGPNGFQLTVTVLLFRIGIDDDQMTRRYPYREHAELRAPLTFPGEEYFYLVSGLYTAAALDDVADLKHENL